MSVKNIAWYEGGEGSSSSWMPCAPSTPAARALQMYLQEETELDKPIPPVNRYAELNSYSETREQLIERHAGIVWLNQNDEKHSIPDSLTRAFALYAE